MNGVIIHKRLRLRVLKENNNRTSKQMFVQISIAPETDNVNSFKKLRLKFLVWCKQIKNQEKYLDKIETADIIETVMMNQKRVYLYKESVEKTSRIVELDRERRRRKSLK